MTQYAGQPKIATTIPLPDANTPFNADAIGAPIAGTFDGVKAIELYGVFNTNFSLAKPPYTVSAAHINNGTYAFGDNSNFVFIGNRAITFSSPSARPYSRPVTSTPHRSPDSWWSNIEEEISGTGLTVNYKQKYSPLSPSTPWLIWHFHMPSYSTLTGVETYIHPASAADHGGNLPAEQPIIKLWWYSHITGLATEIPSGEVQDAQATANDYALAHKLEVTGLTYGPSTGNLWEQHTSLMIGIRGEEGANAVAAAAYADSGLRIRTPRVHFTRSRLGEE